VETELRGDATDVNAVRLRGRLSSVPTRRTLPSGDEVVGFRVVVRRPEGGSVDTIDVSVGPAPAAGRRRQPGQVGRRALAAVQRLDVDQRIEVAGELRRRWWDAGGARRSRLEVRAGAVIAVVDDTASEGSATS
jgi:single-strand DNA-binding protein